MNRLRGGAALLSVLTLVGCTPPMTSVPLTSLPRQAVSERGQVIAVVDGDTIDVATDDGDIRVRLIGINTPEIGRDGEPGECYAVEARAFLDELLYGRMVELESDSTQADTDNYGRQLRHIVIDGQSAAVLALEAGAGYEYTYDEPYFDLAAYIGAESDGIPHWCRPVVRVRLTTGRVEDCAMLVFPSPRIPRL